MEKRDLLILEYLSKGFKTNEISQKLMTEHSIKVSKSLIEKRLKALRTQFQAKTLFQLAVILKNENIL